MVTAYPHAYARRPAETRQRTGAFSEGLPLGGPRAGCVRWYDVLVHLDETPDGLRMNELAEWIL